MRWARTGHALIPSPETTCHQAARTLPPVLGLAFSSGSVARFRTQLFFLTFRASFPGFPGGGVSATNCAAYIRFTNAKLTLGPQGLWGCSPSAPISEQHFRDGLSSDIQSLSLLPSLTAIVLVGVCLLSIDLILTPQDL